MPQQRTHTTRSSTKPAADLETKAKPKKPKAAKKLLDEVDTLLEEIDTVLEEVAGGKTTEFAQAFVAAYVQKGGQ